MIIIGKFLLDFVYFFVEIRIFGKMSHFFLGIKHEVIFLIDQIQEFFISPRDTGGFLFQETKTVSKIIIFG